MDAAEARERLDYLIHGLPWCGHRITDARKEELAAWEKALSFQDEHDLYIRVINDNYFSAHYAQDLAEFLDCSDHIAEAAKWYLISASWGNGEVEAHLISIYSRTRNFWTSGGGYDKNMKPKIQRYVDHREECLEMCRREEAGLPVDDIFLFSC